MTFFTAFMNELPGNVSLGIIWGIMAVGVYITFRILDIADLTVDGSFATGGAVFVVCAQNNINLYLCLFYAFLAGCLAGFVTGILHTAFGIPAILAGILSQLALYSINLRILGERSNIAINWRNYNFFVTSNTQEQTKTIIVLAGFAIALVAVLYWFFGTEFGSAVRATGCNLAMSRANGINTNANKVLGLLLSNGIVAASGALLAQYQGSADINKGKGAIVIGLAAVIIGEVIFGKIFKNFALTLVAVVFGGIIYYLVISIVLKFKGFNPNDLKMLTAIVVALFLGVPYWKSQFTARFGVKEKKPKKIPAAKGGNTNA